ncbi:MAG: hypothetical protein HQK60_01850 [Deltaproteobacteria bacterium]|nr:hypothetical protein [Deltaproteobacteria bacterium]
MDEEQKREVLDRTTQEIQHAFAVITQSLDNMVNQGIWSQKPPPDEARIDIFVGDDRPAAAITYSALTGFSFKGPLQESAMSLYRELLRLHANGQFKDTVSFLRCFEHFVAFNPESAGMPLGQVIEVLQAQILEYAGGGSA